MFYRRNLPHWQSGMSALFLTAHAAGSLPQASMCRLRAAQMGAEDGLERSRRLF